MSRRRAVFRRLPAAGNSPDPVLGRAGSGPAGGSARKKDNRGNRYVDVGTVRLTYVLAARREEKTNWAGSNVVRVSAYREEVGGRLHRGAEFPIGGPDDVREFVDAFTRLCTQVG